MSIEQAALSFAVVAALLTLVPGIDTSLVLRSALTRGRAYSFATAVGVCTGALAWGILAAVGASAVLSASELAYRILTLAGAGYMVWLGVSLIAQSLARRGQPHTPADVTATAYPSRSLARAWLTGLATNLLNPKVGVFYIATIPQFIPAGVSPVLMGLLLAAIHAALTIVWFSVIIIGTGFVSRRLSGPRAVRVIDLITGTVLIGFGAKLALAER